MRILGIDPGLEKVGFGVIETCPATNHLKAIDWGLIKTTKLDAEIVRIHGIHHAMKQLVQQIKPDIAVIERLFFFRNLTTMVPVSQARGVILLALYEAGIPYYEVSPLEVKLNLTGSGKAQKREIQEMVQQLLGLDKLPKPDDAADALGIAICHQMMTIKPLTRKAKNTSKLVVLNR